MKINITMIGISAQVIGVGIYVSNLIIDIPRYLFILALLLVMLPLVTTGEKEKQNGYIMLLAGITVMMVAVTNKLDILWFIGGLVLMTSGFLKVARVMISEIKQRIKESKKQY
ncbi:hypothetical protein ACTG16_23125 [Aeromonas sp. 23P]|uniref:hypothetical protein n=1 Tax=Aeromonas sp. 23P TaxID=3452716 RepID=UPI003F7B1382